MKRKVEILPRGWRDLRGLDRGVQQRVLDALEQYAEIQAGDVKRLQDWPQEYRLRVGEWRIFFHLEQTDVIAVFRIDNRGSAD